MVNRVVSVIISAEMMKMPKCIDYAETNANLEENYAIQNQWKRKVYNIDKPRVVLLNVEKEAEKATKSDKRHTFCRVKCPKCIEQAYKMETSTLSAKNGGDCREV